MCRAGCEPATALASFAGVTTAVSAGFWVLGTFDDTEFLVPGLPASAGMFVAPALGAWAAHGCRRGTGRSALAAGARVPLRQPLPLIAWSLLMPTLVLLSWLHARTRSAETPSALGWTWSQVAILVGVFVVTAACEELGWTWFLTPRLLARCRPSLVGVLIGVCMAALHVIPYAQADRSPAWIGWQCAFTIASRLVVVVAYVLLGRSVWPAVTLHAGYNLAWALFPTRGSHYDPAVLAVLTGAAAWAAVTALERSGSGGTTVPVRPRVQR